MFLSDRKIHRFYHLRILLGLLPRIKEFELSIRIRIFLLLALFTISIFVGIVVILLLTGTLTSGVKDTEKNIDQQLTHLTQEMKLQYDQTSAYTIALSNELSDSMENSITSKGLAVTDLKSHPEILEPMMQSEFENMTLALQKSNCSGVFVILDATVNPDRKDSEHSKAGLYIKNMEPNILHANDSYYLLLRGFSGIGRQHAVPLHSQWRMEFDVTAAPYFTNPLKAAKVNHLPLSRLYYWSPATKLPGSSEEVMLCTAPLIDSNGAVFGVCGFEISSMLFKLAYAPDNEEYERLTFVLSPASGDMIYTSEAFLSGNLKKSIHEKNQALSIRKDRPFNSYRQADGTLYSGLHQPIKLYSKGSAFEYEKWTTAMILPDEDLSDALIKMNLFVILLLLGLLAIGIAASYVLSKKFLTPFLKAMEITQLSHLESKTSVTETTPAIDVFAENIKSLSPAERAVFDLYAKGYTAKEITEILCLSINTIKTHSKRIYMKLNVANREELFAYVSMMKEAGKTL